KKGRRYGSVVKHPCIQFLEVRDALVHFTLSVFRRIQVLLRSFWNNRLLRSFWNNRLL
uniref:Uncharacterized protein n=1 Tax=Marmota marmota marmota TaxID=9994 RepID=A0A8C6ADE9_MARMA